MTLTSGSLDISWNLLVSSFSRPTPHCSTRFWPPQMLCSNTSPNHLDFRLHDSGMPWVFLGWTSQKMRILGSNFCIFLLRFFASLLSLLCSSVNVCSCSCWSNSSAAIRSRSVWRIWVVRSTSTTRCFTISLRTGGILFPEAYVAAADVWEGTFFPINRKKKYILELNQYSYE